MLRARIGTGVGFVLRARLGTGVGFVLRARARARAR